METAVLVFDGWRDPRANADGKVELLFSFDLVLRNVAASQDLGTRGGEGVGEGVGRALGAGVEAGPELDLGDLSPGLGEVGLEVGVLEEKRQGLAYGWDTGKGGPQQGRRYIRELRGS